MFYCETCFYRLENRQDTNERHKLLMEAFIATDKVRSGQSGDIVEYCEGIFSKFLTVLRETLFAKSLQFYKSSQKVASAINGCCAKLARKRSQRIRKSQEFKFKLPLNCPVLLQNAHCRRLIQFIF